MNKSYKILISGSGGQLGSEFEEQLSKNKAFEVKAFKRNTLDISNPDQIKTTISEFRPDLMINCAAYTAVDKAETEIDLCHSINNHSLKYLGDICALHKTKLLHFSTDYVFDGLQQTPYSSGSQTNPLNVYGTSKRDGEETLSQTEADYLILRLSWVYSKYGKNFPKTISRLLQEKKELHIVNDQVSSPTWTFPLVKFLIDEIVREKDHFSREIHHWSEKGEASWFDIATLINAKHKKSINPVSSDYFNAAAARPAYSKLKNSFKENFSSYHTDWKQNLEKFLHETTK